MAYDRRGPDREVRGNTREFEDLVYRALEDMIQDDYEHRRLEADMRDACIEILRHSVGEVAKQCDEYLRHPAYARESEIYDWADRIAPNFERRCYEIIQEQIDRDRRSYRRDDRRRGSIYDSRIPLRGPGSIYQTTPGTFGSNLSPRRDDANAERDRRAAAAAAGSQREREKDRRQGLNQPVEQTAPVEKKVVFPDKPGTTYMPGYAVIANKDQNKQIQITTVPTEVAQPTNNNLYQLDSRDNVIVGNTFPVDTRKYYVKCPTKCFDHAFGIIQYDDPTVISPKYWSYFVTFLKVDIGRAPGIGLQILQAQDKVKSIVSAKQLNPQTKLMNLAIALNELPERIRNYFIGKLLRKWNILAMTCFAIPAQPNAFLSAASLEQLQSFYPDTLGASDQSVIEKTAALMSASKHNYADRLNAAVHHVLQTTFEGRCGFVDVRKGLNLEMLSMFDRLPFVVDKNKRPSSLAQMTDEEKSTLGQMFAADWVCTVDACHAIVSNLTPSDLKVERPVTCISATDAAVPAYYREVLGDRLTSYMFYSATDKKPVPHYIGHLGLGANKDLMMVEYRPE